MDDRDRRGYVVAGNSGISRAINDTSIDLNRKGKIMYVFLIAVVTIGFILFAIAMNEESK